MMSPKTPFYNRINASLLFSMKLLWLRWINDGSEKADTSKWMNGFYETLQLVNPEA